MWWSATCHNHPRKSHVQHNHCREMEGGSHEAWLWESPDKIRGMKNVLSILKFSYDNLEDDVRRECLLYCSLFPEDHNIKVEQLIGYWIGEGFPDVTPDSSSISQACDIGYCMIRKLKNACLLESGDDKDRHVKMHDTVHEMALWLTGNNKTNRFVVCGGRGFTRLSEIGEWEGAVRRISLVQQDIFDLPSPASKCLNLLTLLVIANPFRRLQETLVVPPSLFEFVPSLCILDRSHTSVKEIPGKVGLLVELRYLNLLWTKITQLPEELGKLVKLRELSLWGTVELAQIPRKAIITLTGLQRLYLYRCGISSSLGNDASGGINWMDLDSCMGRLEEFSIDIHNTPSLESLATSCLLSRCVRGLRLVNISDLSSSDLSTALEQLVNLEWLSVEDCHQLQELRIVGNSQLQKLRYLGLAHLNQLRNVLVTGKPMQEDQQGALLPTIQHVEIDTCDRLKDLGWLFQLPSLENLLLWSCRGMETILPLQVKHASPLSLLKYMSLVDLPSLRKVSVRPLALNSLELLWVSGCPLFRTLPLEAHSYEKIREIFGSTDWWVSLEGSDDGDNGRSLKQNASLTSSLHESFHPISTSSPREIVAECRERFL